MDEETWADVLAAYRHGATSDFLWVSLDDSEAKWGALWTIPPCSLDSAERAARQFARVGVRRLRHARRAILRRGNLSEGREDRCAVVVVTVLPGPVQEVRCLESGRRLQYRRAFLDEVLKVLMATLAVSFAAVIVVRL